MSYHDVMARVGDAVSVAGRNPEDVTLVAVSKTKSVEEIRAVYDEGHRDFGENRAQELAAKAPHLPADIRWHFVGHLQSNKARTLRGVTTLLHSMDRDSLAKAWLKGQGNPPPVLVQVNIDEEPQKSGVTPNATGAFIDRLVHLGVEVRGLMAIPKLPEKAEDSREAFRNLRRLADEIAQRHEGVRQLSMGMTDDFEVAIAEGASFIRVGRAIFGDRKPTGD